MLDLQTTAALSTLYAEKHRHYHDITHIMNCLAELENFVHPDLTTPKRNIVEAAIWFHDAIYNPYSTLNEHYSAKLVSSKVVSYTEIVHDLVILTRDHLVSIDWGYQTYLTDKYVICGKVLMDIDLSGFGKSWDEYKRNGDNIRKEYYNTSDIEFYIRRLGFLEKLAKKDTLYYTDYFRTRYHSLSQKNLKRDIEETRTIIATL